MKNATLYILCAALLLALATAPVAAQSFPAAPSDDVIPSLGRVIIWVDPGYAHLVSSTPGWNNPAYPPGHWVSPLLFDPSTVIGHSAAHADGSTADTAGTPVGTTMTVVSDGNFGLGPHVNEGPPGQQEVHTEIRSLNMTELCPPMGPVVVRAGTDMGVATPSFGEVEALGASSFPAESFFHVYVEVDMPFGTLYNSLPLVVSHPRIWDLPPNVVYIHGLTPAVPVYFKGSGVLFGYLRLAGHQANCGDPCGGCPELDEALSDAPLMPCDECFPYNADDVEPQTPTGGVSN